MDIPTWFWLVLVGVTGQSFCGFYFAHRTKFESANKSLVLPPLLLTNVMHGLGVAALAATLHFGQTALWSGLGILFLSIIPMRRAVIALNS